jgi:hypothetical protein
VSDLQERLDALGWYDGNDPDEYRRRVFLLLEQLVREVESLKTALRTKADDFGRAS